MAKLSNRFGGKLLQLTICSCCFCTAVAEMCQKLRYWDKWPRKDVSRMRTWVGQGRDSCRSEGLGLCTWLRMLITSVCELHHKTRVEKNLHQRSRVGKKHQRAFIASLISYGGTWGETPLPHPQSPVSVCCFFQFLLSSDTLTETAVFSHTDPGPREIAAAGFIPASSLHICVFWEKQRWNRSWTRYQQ